MLPGKEKDNIIEVLKLSKCRVMRSIQTNNTIILIII